MTSPRYAELASKLLARGEVAVAPPTPGARIEAIGALQAALRSKRQGRQRMRWALGITAFAAATLLGLGLRALIVHPVGGAVAGIVPGPLSTTETTAVSVVAYPSGAGATVATNPASPDQTAALADGKAVTQGSRVAVQPGGRLILAFSTGSQLSVEDEGDVTLSEVSASQRFDLHKGTVRADVAKLAPGQRFVVRTSDAEAEAHGTSFRVSVVPSDASCGNGTPTRLVVYEGVVAVRLAGQKEDLVSAGQEWPRCSPAVSPNPSPAGAADDATNRVEPRGGPAANARASSLADQNDMFAVAEQAKRSGATLEAIADFDRLLAKYPQSQLSESAMAERMRLLRNVDRVRAGSAARQYLARYPRGFARGDAEGVLANSP